MRAPEGPADTDAVSGDEASFAERLKGRAIYSKRKATVETVFGVIKEVLGFRRFHLRGLRGARGRMESGVHGVESEAAVCPGGRRISGVRWVPVDELWRTRTGCQRHVGGCCWHHDPSRTT